MKKNIFDPCFRLSIYFMAKELNENEEIIEMTANKEDIMRKIVTDY